MTAPSERWRHLDGLDGLRGVAIVLVVTGHIGLSRDQFGGPVGVTLFFVLSGYLITSLLLREHREAGRISLLAFYARRGLRLLPALALFLVAVPVVIKAMHDPGLHGQYLQVAPFAALYATNFLQSLGANLVLLSHTWSLSLEEQFYLVWPAVLIALLLLTRRRPQLLVWSLGTLALVAFAWHIQGTIRYDFLRAYFAPDTSAFALLCGAFLAALPQRQVRPVPTWSTVALLGGLVVLSCAPRVTIWSGDLSLWIQLPTVLLAAALIVCARQRSVLDQPVLVWFGQISYGLYLWHFTLMELHPHGHLMTNAERAGMAVVAVGFAYASRHLVELPALRLKTRLSRVETVEPEPTRGWRLQPQLVVAAIGAFALLLPAGGLLLRAGSPNTVPAAVRKTLATKHVTHQLAHAPVKPIPTAAGTTATSVPDVSASRTPVVAPPRVLTFVAPLVQRVLVVGCREVAGQTRFLYSVTLVGGSGWQPDPVGLVGREGDTFTWYLPDASDPTVRSVGVLDESKTQPVSVTLELPTALAVSVPELSACFADTTLLPSP